MLIIIILIAIIIIFIIFLHNIFANLEIVKYVIIVMNKNLIMLCITYYSGLEILLIQSSTSQICVFVDHWQLQIILSIIVIKVSTF